MGSDTSKTQIRVQNKEHDPAKVFKDNKKGQPIFEKRNSPRGENNNENEDEGHNLIPGQGLKVGRHESDFDQVSVTTYDRVED